MGLIRLDTASECGQLFSLCGLSCVFFPDPFHPPPPPQDTLLCEPWCIFACKLCSLQMGPSSKFLLQIFLNVVLFNKDVFYILVL